MKKILLSFTALALVASQSCMVFADGLSKHRENEPNDTFMEAKVNHDGHMIELSKDSNHGFIVGTVNQEDKSDFIPIRSDFSGELELKVTGPSNYRLYYYNDGGIMMSYSWDENPGETAIHEMLLKKNKLYFVRVEYLGDNEENIQPYTLTANIKEIVDK